MAVSMKIFIKHMVSMRCIVLVKDELKKLGLMFTNLELGSVILLKNLTDENRVKLSRQLSEAGLELHLDKKGILVEEIKRELNSWLLSEDLIRIKYSAHLTRVLKYKYNYLSNVFTEVEGITIQTYLINQKIELIKELLSYGEMNLSEIADRLNYCSSAHMSSQFKKATGMNPSLFRKRHS
jgi:AraC-like DNA-binding protein